jgi:hypothetical protein
MVSTDTRGYAQLYKVDFVVFGHQLTTDRPVLFSCRRLPFLCVSCYSQNVHIYFCIRDYVVGFCSGDVTASRWELKSLHSSGVVADVLGRSIGPNFMGQAFQEDWIARFFNLGPTCSAETSVQEDWTVSPLKLGPVDHTETSVTTGKLRNVPEGRRLALPHGGSLKYQIAIF